MRSGVVAELCHAVLCPLRSPQSVFRLLISLDDLASDVPCVAFEAVQDHVRGCLTGANPYPLQSLSPQATQPHYACLIIIVTIHQPCRARRRVDVAPTLVLRGVRNRTL